MTAMALAVIAVLAGALVQSATGFGFALVAGPALLAALDPAEAVMTALGLGLVLNLLMLFAERRDREVRTADVARFGVGALPGVGAGVLVLRALPKPALQVLVGAVVVAAGLVELRGRRGFRVRARPASGYLIGLVSGTLTTSTSVNGPPLVLWLQARGARSDALRDSTTAGLLCLSLLGLGTLAAIGSPSFAAISPTAALVLVAAAAAGHFAGRRVFLRLDARRHGWLVLALVLVAGTASVAAGAVGLAG